MYKELIASTNPFETRVALLEDGQLCELYIERKNQTRLVGNIYKGKVTRVLPGMEAAFVDIGISKDAFLYIDDVHYFSENIQTEEEEDQEEIEDQEGLDPDQKKVNTSIDDLLIEGQEILVHVVKEAIGTKGPRVTSHVSFPGRYVVYMPTIQHIGISRRIPEEQERRRLRNIIENIRDDKGGYILRTACEGHEEDELKSDMIILHKLWNEVKEKYDKGTAPCLLHKDLGIIQRLARDVFTSEISCFILDNQNEYTELLDFVNKFFPHLTDRVKLYSSGTPIFEKFNIENEITKALRRKVWLKSGGYIVFDQTEALVSIDVNTGKYLGSNSLEETIVKTNIEACREIVRQLRLRNLGGIIIIDFIDMEEPENRDLIFETLEAELKNDRARTTILQISKLGLIEMTRKRIKISLENLLTRTCPYCQGKGTIKNNLTILSEIHKELYKNAGRIKEKEIILRIHPDLAQDFYKNRDLILDDIFGECHPNLTVKLDPNLHQGNFDIIY